MQLTTFTIIIIQNGGLNKDRVCYSASTVVLILFCCFNGTIMQSQLILKDKITMTKSPYSYREKMQPGGSCCVCHARLCDSHAQPRLLHKQGPGVASAKTCNKTGYKTTRSGKAQTDEAFVFTNCHQKEAPRRLPGSSSYRQACRSGHSTPIE